MIFRVRTWVAPLSLLAASAAAFDTQRPLDASGPARTTMLAAAAAAVRAAPWRFVAGALVLAGAAYALHRWRVRSLRRHEQRLEDRIQEALAHIKVLSGLIPICSGCKRIRADDGYWQQIEEYIRAHSEAQFSHGLCPTCVRDIYPEYAETILAGTPTAKR